MIIVEGADHVGKTTLCKKLLQSDLLRQMGYVYSSFTRLPPGFHYYHGYEQAARTRTVQDRFHMSEIVYSKARRESRSPLSPEQYRRVDALCRLRCAFTVVVTCEREMLKQRLHDNPKDEMYGIDKILDANDYFGEVCNISMRCFTHGDEYHHVDWDFQCICHDHHPFPNDFDVEQILGMYMKRRISWERDVEAMAERRELLP